MLIDVRFYLLHLKCAGLLALAFAVAGAAGAQEPAPPASSEFRTPSGTASSSQSIAQNMAPGAPQRNPPGSSQNNPQSTPQDRAGHPLGAAPLPDAPPHPASRLEIFGGYSFIELRANINNQYKYNETDGGPITSGTLWFNKRFGVQAEGAIHEQTPTSCYSTAQAGPVARFFVGPHLSPYLHLDAGTTRIGIRGRQGCAFNLGATAGAGLDYILPDTGNHFAFRIFQADYDYARLKYTVGNGTVITSGTTSVNVPRISSGFVLRLGNFEHPLAKSLDCHTDPSSALAGEKIVLAAYAQGYSFGQKFAIHWSSTAGKVIYPGPDVLVDTTGVEPGVYSATAIVTRGKSSKPLLQCAASFEVKTPPVPTIRCSSEPASINPAETSTITATASSDAKRQLFYSFNATDGQIRRNSNVGIFDSARARPGTVTITCRVQDDLGQVAEATTHVTVLAPPVPPQTSPAIVPETAPAPAPRAATPAADKMCSLPFDRDLSRPTRLDSAAIACLDDIAARLQQAPGTRATLIGNHGRAEEDGPRHAAQRTFNARSYLVHQKHVDASRIDIRTGSSTNRSVEVYFLAPGMHFDPPPTEQNREE